MKIVRDTVTISELRDMAAAFLGVFVKAAVDVEKDIMAIDAELHADLRELLMEEGSDSKNIWGINLYPEKTNDDFVEFDSMINIKPGIGNRTRGINSMEIREKIKSIVKERII